MLLLADQRLIDEIGAAPEGDVPNPLLLRQADGLWLKHGEGQAPQPLSNHLQDWLAKRPAVNRAVFLWGIPDDELIGGLSLLQQQTAEFDIEAAIFLGRPLWKADVCEPVSGLCSQQADRMVHSIAFTGRQDISGDPVADERRFAVLRAVINILTRADDQLLTDMGLFFRNLEQPPFCAFVLESHARKPEEVPVLVTGYTRQLLAEAFQAEAARRKSEDRDLESQANGILDRLGTLHLPRKVNEEGGQGTESWDASLHYIENCFEAWRCPWLKKPALASGNCVLRDQRNTVEKGHRQLVRELHETSLAIRESAGNFKDRTIQEIHALVRDNATLGGLAHLLRSFFPVFSALRRERLKRALAEKTPCISAEWPSLVEAHQRFVLDARTKLEDLCAKLPLPVHALGGAVGLLAGLGLGIYLFPKPISPWLVWFPVGVAVVVNAVFWFMAWLRRRRAMREMTNHTAEACKWLRDSFVQKVLWVLGKTQINLETRVVSEVIGIGRRLDANMNALLEEWDRGVDASEDMTMSLAAAGLTPDAIKELATAIRGISSEVAESSLRHGDEWDGQHKVRALFDGAVAQGIRTVMRSVVPEHEERDWLLRMAAQRREPPILARLDESHLQLHTVKCFALPDSYDRDLDQSLHQPLFQQTSVTGSVWFGGVSGPCVWHARRFLSAQEAEFALTATEVKS
jgi:hypothetical protein